MDNMALIVHNNLELLAETTIWWHRRRRWLHMMGNSTNSSATKHAIL